MGLILTIVGLAYACWEITNHVVQPTWKAHCVIQLHAAAQPPANRDEWVGQQRTALLSDAVLNETLNLLNQRGVELYKDLPALRDDLAVRLSVVYVPLQSIRLECVGQDKEGIRFLLEALSRAAIVYHEQAARSAGKMSEATITQAALRDPSPIVDRRIEIAGISYGSSLLVALALWLVMKFMLRRTARLVQMETAGLAAGIDDPKLWPEPSVASRADGIHQIEID